LAINGRPNAPSVATAAERRSTDRRVSCMTKSPFPVQNPSVSPGRI
jgi:hypothetical protein